ncbi:MAG: aromatic ring-hydroxylating dioxygenase subunit alpha [Alphaproteobacteria bacterium]|nr:MAG: aromatic ring-hydroxylating dioxygenase subunit alpha [Alphaproteobacteria bacterium]
MSYSIFNRTDVVAEGWYWLLAAKELKRGQVRAVNILGHELAVFRGKDGKVAALDAYCPHMGAHLAEGRVEGNQLRCFFHNWRFDAAGQCTDIPCLANKLQKRVQTRAWVLEERNGLIWIWLGSEAPVCTAPEAPELAGADYEYSLGNRFIKHCHPNVVMVNAIDEQHFHTVHRLPGSILSMQPQPRDARNIEFHNTGTVPRERFIGRCIARFYKHALTYNLSYWFGSAGTVTLGPDFLHLYLMFALRLTPDGRTEGRTVVFTRRRKGLFGWLFNRVVLSLTKIAGYYFAVGDTRIFQTIRFNLKTPIAADRAVLAFIHHLEQQTPYALNQAVPAGARKAA